METLDKNVTDAATEISNDATEFSAKNELGKKLEEAKKSAEEFAKEKGLDVKAKEAKEKAMDFAKKNELDKKYDQVKESVETFVKEHGLDVKSDDKTIERKERTTEEESYPGDVTMEALKKEIDTIARKIESETKNLMEKEEVQKVLTLLMAKLAILKSKFIAIIQKRKNKGSEKECEEELGIEVELGKEGEADVAVVEKALDDAEATVEKIAERFGIHLKSEVEEGKIISNNNAVEVTAMTIKEKETVTENEGYPGDATMDALKKEVDTIAQKVEVETKNLMEKEEVQKVLTGLMAKLSIAKSKFIAMTQKKKGEDNKAEEEEELGLEVELGKEQQVRGTVVEESSNSVPSTDDEAKEEEEPKRLKLKRAVKKALENAEAAVKKAADKFGIQGIDQDETKTENNDKTV